MLGYTTSPGGDTSPSYRTSHRDRKSHGRSLGHPAAELRSIGSGRAAGGGAWSGRVGSRSRPASRGATNDGAQRLQNSWRAPPSRDDHRDGQPDQAGHGDRRPPTLRPTGQPVGCGSVSTMLQRGDIAAVFVQYLEDPQRPSAHPPPQRVEDNPPARFPSSAPEHKPAGLGRRVSGRL